MAKIAEPPRERCSRCGKLIYGAVYYDKQDRPLHRDCWSKPVSAKWRRGLHG